MICQITALNLNATKRSAAGKTLTGVEVSYQGRPYKGVAKEPTTRFLFSDNAVAKALDSFKIGDWVEIEFDTDKFKTPKSIRKHIEGEAVVDKLPYPSTPSSPRSFGAQDEGTQKRIARAVAIKEATTLIVEMAKQGAFTAAKTKSYEFLSQQVLEVAKIYEPYLACTEQPDAVINPETVLNDIEQDGFDD